MKSLNVKICALIVVFGLIMSFSSCKKDEPGPGLVKFAVSSASFSEADGDDKNVTVSISAKQSADVTITWTYTVTGETYLDGDFSIPSTDAIIIAAGQTTGHIVVHVIDDTQIDADDDVTLTLTAVTGNAKLSTTAAELKYDMTITNDDTTPSNEMQADLTWSTGDGISVDNIDVDLFLQYNVVINGSTGHVDDIGSTLYSSTYATGFESLWVESGDTDQDYYLAVQKASTGGSGDFTLSLHGFGWNGESDGNSFASTDAQFTSYFFGPFTKSLNTFPFTGRSGSLVPKNGKILCYKVDNFPAHPKTERIKH